MTTQSDYQCHEWDLIVGAPGLIALALTQATPCSDGAAYQRARAVIEAIEETDRQGSPSRLIRSVVGAARAGQSPLWPTRHPCDLRDAYRWALGACRQVAGLLAQKAPEDEAEAYTQWLILLAQRVAAAPDERQRAALEELADALDARSAYNETRSL